jgi:uncharacterized protein (TIRG00374 family)
MILLAVRIRSLYTSGMSKRLGRIIERVLLPLRQIVVCKRVWIRLSLLSLASVLARWAGLYRSFRFCGFQVAAAEILLIETVRTAALVVNITPGNIGVTEGLIAACGKALGIDGGVALVSSVVSRLLSMALHAVLGLWFTRRLMKTG